MEPLATIANSMKGVSWQQLHEFAVELAVFLLLVLALIRLIKAEVRKLKDEK
jgi:hypothetical protein